MARSEVLLVDHRIALAGFDAVAVDSMCARLMGIPLENVGYLNYCASAGIGNMDRARIDIIGSNDPEKSVITYKTGVKYRPTSLNGKSH